MSIRLGEKMKSAFRLPLPMACIALLGVGLACRAEQFRANRGFWLDEAWLASALDAFDPAAPARPLPFHQAAPLAFLFLTRTAVQTLGTSEWVYRLLPFVAGCLLVVLWLPLLRRALPPTALLASLALVAVSSPLLHYAAEFKPYGVDACVTLVLLGLTLRTIDPARRGALGDASLVFAGGLAPLLSFTAPLVLAACGLALADAWRRTRDPRTLRVAACCVVLWGGSYAALHVWYVSPLNGDPYLQAYWQPSYAPWRLWTQEALRWYGDLSFAVFAYWFGEICAGLAFALGVVGGVQLLRRQRPLGIVVVAVPVLVLIASLAGFYPLKDRLLLFMLPLVIVAVASGLQEVFRLAVGAGRPLALVVAATLLVPPAFAAWQVSRYPLPRHDPRPLLAAVAAQARAGDTLYVEWSIAPVARWYAARYALNGLELRYGEERAEFHLGAPPTERWPFYTQELAALEGRERVWVLLDQFINDARRDEAWFLGHLDAVGQRLFSQQGPRASLHLYDLRREPK